MKAVELCSCLTCSCAGAPRAVALSIARGQPVIEEINITECLCAGAEVVGSDQLLVAQGGGEVTGGVACARPGGRGDSRGEVSLQGGKKSIGACKCKMK